MNQFRFATSFLVAISLGSLSNVLAEVRFNESIRPILSDKCFFCHGPDASKRQADLRLDDFEQAVSFGAISPGNPDKSPILDRMMSHDPDVQMPPPSSKLPRITKEELETVRSWIKEGAKYEKHWSFESLEYERLSPQANSDPIDGFVKQELAKRKWKLQPQADRRTLARRASFDIRGLPPSAAEVQAFVDDSSDNAWERYIDRLLDSPQYGERMAVDWLDISRYADSYGFQVDRERPMWPWRDWVIRSFNANKPFDEFIVEQLAGDLLPNPTKDQILATAFNRLHQQESEGGSVEEEYRVEYVADRVQTYATAFLGLTFECARCHDHKYDPISQKEYYGLFAMFQNIDEAGLYSYFTESPPTPAFDLTTDDQDQKLALLRQDVDKARQELETYLDQASKSSREEIKSQFAASSTKEPSKPILSLDFEALKDRKLTNSAATDKPATVDGENELVEGIHGKAIQFTGDDAVKTTQGNFGRHEPFSVALWIETPDTKDRAVVFHRSRAWTDAASRGYELLIEEGKWKWSLIHFWPGNAISIRSKQDVPIQKWTHVTVTYDGSSEAKGLKIYMDGARVDVDVIRDNLTKTIGGGGYDHIDLAERFRDRGFKGGKIDDFQVYNVELTESEVATNAGKWNAPVQPDAFDQLSDDQYAIVKSNVITRSHEVVQRNETLRLAREKLYAHQDSLTNIMVMRELDTPKPAYVLARGEYNLRGALVSATTPAILNPFPETEAKNRLGLARWTVSRDHPLTARVTVNRVWQSVFGRGLVKTSEDFGSQGARPLYQNILDSLSIRFVESGWNMKALVKAILLSETYRQQSVSSEMEIMTDDPDNELLARGPRFRLPAEMIRDNVLAASGLIDLTMGGGPVNPYEMSESFKPANPTNDNGVYRRSVYTNWRRTGPPPAMVAFDAPRRAVCAPKRERTESPLQALIMLNSPQYVEAAKALATKAYQRNKENDSAIIEQVFQACLNRSPDQREVQICQQLINEQRDFFAKSPDKTKEFLSVGRFVVPDDLPKETIASLTVLCQTLLNHDASVVKR